MPPEGVVPGSPEDWLRHAASAKSLAGVQKIEKLPMKVSTNTNR